MGVWGILGGSIAFVFGFRPEYGLAAWLVGIALGAVQSARLIFELKVNAPVFGPQDIHKTGDL